MTRANDLFSQSNDGFDHQYAAWDALLKRHVKWLPDNKQSRVDYKGFATDQTGFDKILGSFSAVTQNTFDRWTRAQQMVFLTNAYNAFTIKLILSKYPNLRSIKDLGSFIQSAWKKKFFQLLGEERHLDWIEHEQLRPRYKEPRIHVAVNCASIGCPALPPEAFTPARLDAQLEQGMARFLSDHSRNRMADGQLQVSQIFKWFGEDFEKGYQGFSKLDDVFSRYASQLTDDQAAREKLKAGGVSIGYLDYDWSLNDLGR